MLVKMSKPSGSRTDEPPPPNATAPSSSVATAVTKPSIERADMAPSRRSGFPAHGPPRLPPGQNSDVASNSNSREGSPLIRRRGASEPSYAGRRALGVRRWLPQPQPTWRVVIGRHSLCNQLLAACRVAIQPRGRSSATRQLQLAGGTVRRRARAAMLLVGVGYDFS
eukprot:COSAG01_NODE_5279_length_4362_cov_1.789585_3_plen_167_part_00